MKKNLLSALLWLLVLLGLSGAARATAPPAPGRPLAGALNPDGTLRAGANGSFDARQFRMSTAPDGRPVFRPAGVAGAGDERWADGFGVANGADGIISAIAKSGSDLYIGGRFTAVGNTLARNVAHWNGTTWRPMGTGIAEKLNGGVATLAVAANGEVYAGGSFSQAGSVAANNVARWNGSAWSTLGSGATNGTDGVVKTFVLAGSGLYVGGFFGLAGGVTVNCVARWDGAAWYPLGTGTANGVRVGAVQSLAKAPNGDIYVGGDFFYAGSGFGLSYLARWNGTAWSGVGTGVNYPVSALAVGPGGELYAAGNFTQAGGGPANRVARWNGTAWSALGAGVGYLPQALAVAANGDLYMGGFFTVAGGGPFNYLARWDGTAWNPVGTGATGGLYGDVSALLATASGDLYVGGGFTQAGGAVANNVALWSGTAWSALNTGVGQGIGGTSSFPRTVRAVVVAPNGDVYVGGYFSLAGGVPVNNVARWDGTAWHTLGTGATNGVQFGGVESLGLAPNGDLYVGGDFTKAGGADANRIARWDGTAWHSLGTGAANGFNYGTVAGLAVGAAGEVYAVGTFDRANGIFVNGVAKWNGTAWSALGGGVASRGFPIGQGFAVVVAPNGYVYVGGNFRQSGGAPATNLARWNGTAWTGLAAGAAYDVGGPVSALALAPNGDLYVGGSFTLANSVSANYVARWNGSAWTSLGTGAANGVSSDVSALAVAANGDVYAGGALYAQAGGPAPHRLARWNGTGWSALGTGVNNSVYALAFNAVTNKLYVGGDFTTTGDGGKAMAHFAVYDPNAPLAMAAAKAAPAAFFPNPAHGTATLRLPAGAPRLPLALTDALGRMVRRYPAPPTAEAALDLRGLPAGAYVVRCGAVSQRLVVE